MPLATTTIFIGRRWGRRRGSRIEWIMSNNRDSDRVDKISLHWSGVACSNRCFDDLQINLRWDCFQR